MNPRKKLLERLGVQAEPETVERASRPERVKRNLWMVFTTAISVVAAIFLFAIVFFLAPWLLEVSFVGQVFWIVYLFAVLWIDMKLFHWGLKKFDLVVPWQFREAA